MKPSIPFSFQIVSFISIMKLNLVICNQDVIYNLSTPSSSTSQMDQNYYLDYSKTVDFCSVTSTNLPNYTIDYSWTLKDLSHTLMNIGPARDRPSNPFQIQISDLKFHPNVLRGTWSIILSEQEGRDRSMIVSVLYNPPKDYLTSLAVTADLYLAFPWGEKILSMGKSSGRLNGKKFVPKIKMDVMMDKMWRNPIENLDLGDRSGSNVLELDWSDRSYIQQIVDQYYETLNDNTETNDTSVDVDIPFMLKDELSLIFHLEVTIQNIQIDGSMSMSYYCPLGNYQTQESILMERQRLQQPQVDEPRYSSSTEQIEIMG